MKSMGSECEMTDLADILRSGHWFWLLCLEHVEEGLEQQICSSNAVPLAESLQDVVRLVSVW